MSNMNFNCDVCGREVQCCTFVNGMKFCAKCYQETFGETEKDRKIADLKRQLAEKEKEQNQKVIEQLEKVKETINDKYQYLSKLEQQGELTFYGEGAQNLCYLLLKQIDQQIKQLRSE